MLTAIYSFGQEKISLKTFSHFFRVCMSWGRLGALPPAWQLQQGDIFGHFWFYKPHSTAWQLQQGNILAIYWCCKPHFKVTRKKSWKHNSLVLEEIMFPTPWSKWVGEADAQSLTTFIYWTSIAVRTSASLPWRWSMEQWLALCQTPGGGVTVSWRSLVLIYLKHNFLDAQWWP